MQIGRARLVVPALRMALLGVLGVLVVTGCAAPSGAGSGPGSVTGSGSGGAGTTAPESTATADPTDSSAPGGTAAGAPLAADLTITVDDGTGNPKTYRLTCEPAGGDHPDPAAACAALTTAGVNAFAPVPPGQACTQIYGGPQTATVTGTVAGQPIDSRFSRTDGCQVSRWDALAALLTSPGGVVN